MKKWQLILLVGVIIFLVGMFFGAKMAGGLAGIIGLGIGAKKKAINQVERDGEKAKHNTEEIGQRVEDRAKEADKLDKKMQQTEDVFQDYFKIFIIFILSVSLFYSLIPSMAIAAELNGQPPPLGEFKQPDTFAEAKQLANDMKDFALIWREYAYQWEDKYNKEHQDLLELQSTVKNQQEIIDFYKDMVKQLMNGKRLGGLNASIGIDYKPIKPLYTGVTFEVGYQF